MTTTSTSPADTAPAVPAPLFTPAQARYADTVLEVLHKQPPTNPGQHAEAAAALLTAAAHEALIHRNSLRYDVPEHGLGLAVLLTRMADLHARLAHQPADAAGRPGRLRGDLATTSEES